MSAGTLKLTNGSTAVTGTGTTFTVDLTATDFVIVTVGGTTYSLAVDTVTNATALVLSAPFTGPTTVSVSWQAVPRKAMLRVTAELNKQVTEALRLGNENAMNWQAVLSANDTATVVLPDGTTLTGLSWKKLSEIMGSLDINALTPLAAQIRTDAAQVAADKPVIVQAKTDAVNAKNAAAGSQTAAAGSATAAATSAATATTKAADAAKSAQEAANSAASTAYVTTPFPDVWAPLSDDLRLLAGNGTADSITISGTSYPLPSKSMTFARASTATYVDKSGVLQTAAVNVPRFEKNGILLEGQSTNLLNHAPTNSLSWSDPILTTTKAAYPNPACGGMCIKIDSPTATPNETNYTLVDIYGTPAPLGTMTHCLSVYMFGDAAAILDSAPSVVVSQSSPVLNYTALPLVYGSGWVRVSAMVNFDGTVGTIKNMQLRWRNRISSFIVTSYQLEALPFPTSYIPTNGAAATRAADSQFRLPFSGNLPADWVNNSVTFAIQIDNMGTLPSKWADALLISQLTPSGNMRVSFTTIFSYLLQIAGQKREMPNYPPGQNNIVGFVTDGKKVKMFVNGIFSNEMTLFENLTFSPSTTIRFGGTDSADPLFGHIRNLRVWHRALSDIQIRGLR